MVCERRTVIRIMKWRYSNIFLDPAIETMLGSVAVGVKKSTPIVFEAIRTYNQGCGNTNFLCRGNDPLTFQTVNMNEGGGFHNNGTFIAPEDGIYKFEVAVYAYNTAMISMKLTHSNQIFRLYDSPHSGSRRRTVTKTATVLMEKGDGIYLVNESTDSHSIQADTTYPMTFKGFKIN